MIAIRTFMQNTLVGIGLLFILGCQSQPTSSFEVPTFTKPSENPIIRADSTLTFLCPVQNKLVKWQKADVFNPAAIAKDDKIYLLYRAEDNPAASIGGRTSRIGLAYSEDGIHFIKRPTPILFPDTTEFMQYDYPGGCEDPRIVETKDGMYVLTYTSWNRKTARLTIAFSKDLIYWEKKGLAFQKAYDGKFFYQWSKSGAIVTEMYNGKPIAAKIDGKYR